MFSRIARRYDVANHLLSGGMDLWWRRRLVRAVRRSNPRNVLDLATGSGDVAFALSRSLPRATTIVGMDFCQPMLDEAEIKKRANPKRYANVAFRPGDGLNLPLESGSYDTVSISFGLRNMGDREKALRQMRRVLRPGGKLFVLEFSQPHAWFRPYYFFYLKRVLPLIASIVTGDRGAYDYLCASVEQFPEHEGMAAEIRRAGLTVIRVTRMTFGVVALHECAS